MKNKEKKVTKMARPHCHLANKTKKTVWAYTNYTSQTDDFIQQPVDRYGEKGMTFTLTSGFWFWKKTINISGKVNQSYTKFTS